MQNRRAVNTQGIIFGFAYFIFSILRKRGRIGGSKKTHRGNQNSRDLIQEFHMFLFTGVFDFE
jgi:hypothetical protein